LFCSRMRNYSITTCDGKGNCTTRYYCEKNNVTAFCIDNKGEIVWATNLDRKKTYNGWDIFDINVALKGDKFFVSYGSEFGIHAEKKNYKSKKSKKHQNEIFEYAVFDKNNGEYKKHEHNLNKLNTPKKDKKYVDPISIMVIEDEFYTYSMQTGFKPGWIALGCLGAFACPPVVLIPFFSGNARKGSAHLAHIKPIE
ncbi:MAG: hypothetical protein H0X62_16170, partial [Bacteroidetes bacterium]|nr:hypothetical protein [Bacteroidota bacterium]